MHIAEPLVLGIMAQDEYLVVPPTGMDSTTVLVRMGAGCEPDDVSEITIISELPHEPIPMYDTHEPINAMDNMFANSWTTTAMQMTMEEMRMG